MLTFLYPEFNDSLKKTHNKTNPQIFSFLMCAVLLLQSCAALSNPMDCNLPGSSVHGDSAGQKTGVGSQPRDQTLVSLADGFFNTPALADGFFNTSSTWEAL